MRAHVVDLGGAVRSSIPGVALVVLCMLGVSFGARGGARPAQAAGASGVVPGAISARYLTVRPPLGDVTVVRVSGESTARRLLAATLQGVVNRSSARIYLVGARNPAQDQYWIDTYQARGLVHVTATLTLDQALSAYAGELHGYVVASYAEPWTINTATTVAAATGSVVVTPEQVAQLDSLGVPEVANHVGRWSDAATAYAAVAAEERPHLAYAGLAIEQPDQNAPRDFYVQQGIMTVYTRPSQPDFDQVFGLLAAYPPTHPVYGYVADDGNEEVTAIARLSQQGRFLVPTDTTDNLSFHLAVAAAQSRTVLRPARTPVAPCDSSTLNVVIATSDGDNLVIPEAYLPSGDRWESSRRGTFPLGWGISPATAVLMPAVWDAYAATATPADEVVGIMGLGYGIPSLFPDPASFLADSNALAATLGIDTVWSLDLLLNAPSAPGWSAIAAAQASGGWAPAGYLLNYTDFGEAPGFTAAGRPVLTARSTDYAAGPPAIAAHLDALLATAPADRPLVSFFPATVWNATYDSLVEALEPYVSRGVRFLTPRDAFACLAPPSPATTEPATLPATSVVSSTWPSVAALPSGTAGRVTLVAAPVAEPVSATPAYVG